MSMETSKSYFFCLSCFVEKMSNSHRNGEKMWRAKSTVSIYLRLFTIDGVE